MSKTTTVTTSYTSDIVVNGTAISADKIYVNDTQVRRCIVNGKDVIHKLTRTVVTASSDLTLIVQVSFSIRSETTCGITDYFFASPIYVEVQVTDNGSSGVTYVVADITLTFYCEGGDEGSFPDKHYTQTLSNRRFMLGQKTTLTFYYFDARYISDDTKDRQDTNYILDMIVTDSDGVTEEISAYSPNNIGLGVNNYTKQHSLLRQINRILSDTTTQEY